MGSAGLQASAASAAVAVSRLSVLLSYAGSHVSLSHTQRKGGQALVSRDEMSDRPSDISLSLGNRETQRDCQRVQTGTDDDQKRTETREKGRICTFVLPFYRRRSHSCVLLFPSLTHLFALSLAFFSSARRRRPHCLPSIQVSLGDWHRICSFSPPRPLFRISLWNSDCVERAREQLFADSYQFHSARKHWIEMGKRRLISGCRRRVLVCLTSVILPSITAVAVAV